LNNKINTPILPPMISRRFVSRIEEEEVLVIGVLLFVPVAVPVVVIGNVAKIGGRVVMLF